MGWTDSRVAKPNKDKNEWLLIAFNYGGEWIYAVGKYDWQLDYDSVPMFDTTAGVVRGGFYRVIYPPSSIGMPEIPESELRERLDACIESHAALSVELAFARDCINHGLKKGDAE